MQCPACKGTMVVAEYDKIEVDFCTRCSGVWFDGDEMELLVERMSLDKSGLTMNEIIRLPDAPVSEKLRRCPICGKQMRKVYIGTAPKVLIDVCPDRDGTWFDSGELGQVVRQLKQSGSGPAGKHEKVISFLGEVFKAKHGTGTETGGKT